MSEFSFRDAERRLWLEGAEAFADLLHADAVLALPQPGPILQGDALARATEDFPRWHGVTLRSVKEAATVDTHAFAYEAEATRDAETYRCACLSVWTRGADGWRLFTHSETRLPESAA